MMALDAGDQAAGSLLRGLELLMKGQLDQAANQFGVAMRNAPDSPLASFYLGACYAAAGRDKEAVSQWERARAAKLSLPALQAVLADGWLRLGRPADAVEPLREVLGREPQNDNVRRNLAIAQSYLGLHEQAYPTIVAVPGRNPSDIDALLVAHVCAVSGARRGQDHWKRLRRTKRRRPIPRKRMRPPRVRMPRWSRSGRSSCRSSYASVFSSRRTISSFGCTPTSRSTTWPPFNTSRVGMLRTPKRFAVCGFSSMFSFATFTRPAISTDS